MVLWEGFAITGLVGWSTVGCELFVLLPAGGLLAALAALPLFCFEGTRKHAPAAAVTGSAFALGFLPFLLLGHALRMHAFERAGERAAPLVAAVERYVAAHGEPPSELHHLVPRWLDRLPTGVPPLRVSEGRNGNAWMLSASVPSGLLNWDQFVYLPNQDYDSRGWGGRFQRLGRWAYLHE